MDFESIGLDRFDKLIGQQFSQLRILGMSEFTVQYLILERCDPARNIARFYVLTVEPTLFGDTALVREWGRLGQRGRRRLDLFAGRLQAVEALETWLARKTRRGYVRRIAPLANSAQT